MALSLNTIGIPSLFVLSLQSEYYHLSQYPATDSLDRKPIFRSDYESFLLVGDAYIQGLMNGEAMEGLDAGSAHLRDIELR
jgi:hypothetical protein